MAVVSPAWIAMLLFGGACAIAAGEPELRLAGVVQEGARVRLYFTAPAAADVRWLQVGESIGGFQVVAYDGHTGIATVTRGGRSWQVPFAAVSRSDQCQSLSPVQMAAICSNLQRLFAAAKRSFQEGDCHYVGFSDLVGAGRGLPQIVSVAGEDYGRVTFMKGESQRVSVITADGLRLSFRVVPDGESP